MMGSGRSRHLEPFTGADLTRYLIDKRGAALVRQVGDHLHYRLPNGTPVPSCRHGHVPGVLAHRVAERLGITYAELRAELGFPMARNRRKSRGKAPGLPKAPGVRKVEVLDAIAGLRQVADDIESHIRPGARDAEHYRRAYEAVNGARNRLADFATAQIPEVVR